MEWLTERRTTPKITFQSRRTWVLILFGIFHLGYAAATLTIRSSDINPGDAILFELLPVPIRAVAWSTLGLIAISSAPLRRYQKLGWVAAMIMPAERSIGHAWSAIMYYIPGYPPGLVHAPAEFLVWVSLSGVVLITAGWPEPDKFTPVPTGGN